MNNNTENTNEPLEHHAHNHDCCCHSHENKEVVLNDAEKAILMDLARFNCLPISRFIMSSSTEEEARFVALSPVFISALDDSMETVKKIGAILSGLEDKDLITLDYDLPIRGYDYEQYKNSELYAYFKETVKEGMKKTANLCDTAEIELGSMALTEYGDEAVSGLKEG